MNKKYMPYFAGIGMSLIFGATFLFIKLGLEHLDKFVLLTYRFTVALVSLLALHLFKVIKIDFDFRKMKPLFVLGMVNPVLSFIFETSSLQYTTTAQAGTILSLIPIFVLFLGEIFLKEKLSVLEKTFIFISVCGVLVTVLFASSGSGGESNMLGIMLLLVTVIANAIYTIMARKHAQNFNTFDMTFAMVFCGFVFFTTTAVVRATIHNSFYADFIEPLQYKTSIYSVVFLGFFASVIAYLLMNYMYSKLAAGTGSVFNNLVTLVSIFLGVFVAGETLYGYQIAGIILILVGVFGATTVDIIVKKKQAENSKA